jgi:F-type H+-transporting ATPase subunit a
MRFPGAVALLVGLVAAIPAGRAHAQTADTLHSQTAPAAPSLQDGLDAAGATAASVTAAEVQHGTAEAAECGHHGDDFILPHITDSHCFDYPGFPKFWEVHSTPLPRWEPIHVGGVAIDLSPTKHVVFLLIAAVLVSLLLIGAAQAHKRHSHVKGHPKGFAAGIEAMVLYIRNEVAIPNLGHHGAAYAPFILTLFWFILFANLLGLIPYGSTATGNISVTAMLAVITFLVIEAAGMRAQGIGYLNTIFYWNKELGLPIRILMFLIMTPVEIVGKITKPFALAIRLFANMTAGHIVVLAIVGLIFTFQSWFIAGAPVLMAVAIMVLEIFVAFLQAFIFSLLASVFIGQIREAHH